METITDKLRKIAALAESGSPGERENARAMLDAICLKHGVNAATILDQKKVWTAFRFDTPQEKTLLIQTAIMVCGSKKIWNRPPRGNAKSWEFELTASQDIDLTEAWNHFRKEWNAHLDAVVFAFIHANKLYGPSTESEDERKLTPEDAARIQRIREMMSVTPRTPFKKHLKLTA